MILSTILFFLFFVGNIEVEAEKCTIDSECPEKYICCEKVCQNSANGSCIDINADGVNEWVEK